METDILLIAVVAVYGTAVVAAIGYTAYYAAKHGPRAASPLKAWIVAKHNRAKLDRELDKILQDTDKR